MVNICFQAAFSLTVALLSVTVTSGFPLAHPGNNEEAMKIKSETLPLSERFTLRGGSVWSSHAWRQTTGYRETLYVQQYSLVTRTPPWLTWMTGWRSLPSLDPQSNVLRGSHLVSVGQSDHQTTIEAMAKTPEYDPTCVHHSSVRGMYIQSDRKEADYLYHIWIFMSE